ncbi:MAG: carbohydrate-binding domain-containing protein, partial [Candidatus Spyradocola sp.]
MRKILSILLILMLLLTGCSAQPAQTEQTAQNDAAQSTPAPSQQSADAPETGSSDAETIDPGYSDRDREGSYDADDVVARITLDGSTAAVQGEGAAFAGGVLTVTAEGVYVLTGELDGSVTVNAGEDDKVQLVLQDAVIRSADGPAICVDSADKVFVTVPAGSTAVLSDGAVYALAEGEDEPNACVYSKADLTLNGAGTLTVQGSYRHAVNSKDELIVTCGALSVTAVEDGLRGKDGVGIDAGEVTITCGGDGVHSSGDADKPERGWISLDGGTLNITAGSDGVQAATVLQLRGGAVSLTTGGGADAAPAKTEGFGDFGKGGGRNRFGSMPELPTDGAMPEPPTDGEKPAMPADGSMPEPPTDGERPAMPTDGAMPEPPADGTFPQDGAVAGDAQQAQDSTEGSGSAKGLKSDG